MNHTAISKVFCGVRQHKPGPRRSHPVALCAALVALVLGVGVGSTAHAQTTTFIDTLTYSADDDLTFDNNRRGYGQIFKTGPVRDGYELHNMQVRIHNTRDARFIRLQFHINTVKPNGTPDTYVTNVVGDGDFDNHENYDLVAPAGARLRGDTEYMLTIDCVQGCVNNNFLSMGTTNLAVIPNITKWEIVETLVAKGTNYATEEGETRRLRMSISGRGLFFPDPPANLSAEALDASVKLTWDTPDSGADITRHEYRYKRFASADYGSWTPIPTSAPGEQNEDQFTVPGLTNGLNYDFQVQARNSDGAGAPSNTASARAGAGLGICDRTWQVRDAILDAISGVTDCADVTSNHLGTVANISIQYKSLTSLKEGDFQGLTAMTTLLLNSNSLSELPDGIFDGLSSLETLYLSDNDLAALQADVFDDLSSLKTLHLNDNPLTELPAGVFDELSALESLRLQRNELTGLRGTDFEGLTSLVSLLIGYNELSELPDGIFAGLPGFSTLHMLENTVDPLPLTVTLEAVGSLGFRASVPAGAPFDIVVPVSITGGSIVGGASTITIRSGKTKSAVITATQDLETVKPSVELGTLPSKPSGHSGYQLRKPADLSSVTLFSPPPTTTGLTAASGNGQITLAWDAPPSGEDITHYEYRSKTGAVGSVFSPAGWTAIPNSAPGEANDDGFTVGSLVNGVEYFFQVRAVNAVGSGNPSNVASTLAGQGLGICGRSPPVQQAILDIMVGQFNLSADPDCETVTVAQLNSLMGEIGVDTDHPPRSGDYDDLTSITSVRLGLTGVTTIIPGLFTDLGSVQWFELGGGSLTTLPAGVFDGMTELKRLWLYDNALSTGFVADVFRGIGKVEELWVDGNRLSVLPASIFQLMPELKRLKLDDNLFSELPNGIFAGLTKLDLLHVDGNTVDPLPIWISLEQGLDSSFKAVAHAGAPFDIVLPLTVTDGSIDGGATSITIPAGSVESVALYVTRTPGITGAPSVNIGTLPGKPAGHVGYTLSKRDLPLVIKGVTVSPTELPVPEGGSGTYTVVLDAPPSDTVTVTIGGAGGTGVSVNNATLQFTTLNWDTAQTVTVSAAEDADGIDYSVTLTHTLSGGGYDDLGVDDVMVTVADNDRGVTVSRTVLPVPEGGSATYTVVLDREPSSTVGMIIDGMDGTDVSVDDASLVFTTLNWDTAQTVTVSVAEDADGIDDEVTLTHTPSGGGYDGVAGDTVRVLVNDNDSGVTVDPPVLPVPEGGSATYTVVLDALPSGTVTVTISGTSGTDVSVNNATLEFTTTTWDTAQTVTVSAAEDSDAEDDTVTLTHTPAGGGYDGLPDDTTIVTVVDDEPGIIVEPAELPVPEGGSATYTVVLDGQPEDTATVTIGGTSGTDVSVNNATLEFTTSNWNTAQTVTVSAAEDADAVNDSETLIHAVSGGGYGGVSVDNVAVTVADNDRSITIDPTALPVPEGGSANYTVVLDGQPSGTVTVTIGGTSGTDVSVNNATLEFTTSNWNTVQTVTVSAAEDTDAADDLVTLTHTGSGTGFVLKPADDMAVTVADNDRSITIDPTALPVPEGGSASYTVVLDAQPGGTVTVTIGGTSGTDVSVGDATLEFTTTNWNTAQTVTVSATEDTDAADDTVTLTHTPSGGGYDGVVVDDVAVTVADNDRSITIDPTELPVPEGGSASYTVVLDGQPVGTVTVTIGGTSGTDVSVNNATLEFTTTTWNTAQTVTVSAAQDADSMDDSETLTHTVSGGGYGGVSVDDVTVTVADNDREVLVLPTELPVPEGGSASYTVGLDAQPSGTVTVTIGGTSGTDVSVGDATLEFTPENWSTIQRVTVSAAEDTDAADDMVTLTHTLSGASYTDEMVDNVAVTVADNDRSITIDPTALPVPEGGSASYTVVLDGQPSGTVTVTIGGTSGTDVSVGDATLEFTTTNWNTAQTVTVSAAQDADAVNDSETLTHTVSGGGYDGVTADDVTVTVADGERGVTVSTATLPVPEGGSASYTVVLDTQPAGTVTVTIGGTSGTDVSVGDATLEFTTTNWNTTQTVTVSAAQDADEADDEVTLTHTATGGGYDGVTVNSVAVTVEDDEAAYFKLCGAHLGSASGTARDAAVDVCWNLGEPIPAGHDVTAEAQTSSFWSNPDSWSAWEEIRYTPCIDGSTTCIKFALDDRYRGSAFSIRMRISSGGSVFETSPTLQVQAPNADANPLKATLSGPMDEDTLYALDVATGPFLLELSFTDPELSSWTTEMVQGLDVADFQVTNGTLTWEVWDNNTYKLRVAPTVLGQAVTVSLSANTVLGVEEGLTPSGANNYTRSNAASNAITVETGAPLTAEFQAAPATHDGESGFTLRVQFSDDIANTPKYIKKYNIGVRGGALEGVKRVDGRKDLWEVAIMPNSGADVVVRLKAGDYCGHVTGVCTADGRKLSGEISTTIPMSTSRAIRSVPLTAAFRDVPSSHDGSSAFTFTLTFSEDVEGLSYTTLRDSAFTVSGGRVTKARRQTQGSNRTWTIHVAPSGNGAVVITLPETTDCNTAGAICTADARKLSSGDSATVDGSPLTASFGNVPAEHDGSSEFTFRVTFSDALASGGARGRVERALSVTGGTVERVSRVDGRRDLFEARVRPSGNGAVTVSLPASAPCGGADALCTPDDRALSNSNMVTVQGPPGLSVADAEAQEGSDAALSFAVTLSRAASGAVTVDYATSDGTATAGSDYTATSGTLTFTAGETMKTVTVPVLDDSHDDADETLTLTLSNPSGAYLADGSATGTINNSDPLPAAWLVRFGRTSAVQVLELLDNRFDEAATAQAGQLTLGGRPIRFTEAAYDNNEPASGRAGPATPALTSSGRAAAAGVPRRGAALQTSDPAYTGTDSGHAQETGTAGAEATPLERALWGLLTRGSLRFDERRFLANSSFDLSLSAPGKDPDETAGTAGAMPAQPGRWSLWGRGALTQFSGTDEDLALSGNVLTGLLGLDYTRARWLAGVALAYSDGDGSYRAAGTAGNGRLDSALVSVYPYLRYALTERLSVWGALGYGRGDLDLRMQHGPDTPPESIDTGIRLGMGAFGVRGVVYSSADTELALKSDALWVHTAADAAPGLAAVAQADTSRVRLLLSGQRRLGLDNGAAFTPDFELGLRYDDGDAETGFGLELGGGLHYADPVRGMVIETRARALLAHEDGGYEEWGVSGSLTLDPGRLGRGLALRLDSGWGITHSSTGALWSQQTAAGLVRPEDPAAQMRIRAEWSYGLDVPRTGGILTPYSSMELDGGARSLKLGWRFNRFRTLSLSLEGARRTPLHGRADHSLMLYATLPLDSFNGLTSR